MDSRLKKLEEEGFDIKKLAESEGFLTISMQAYYIALRTHQAEKKSGIDERINQYT